LRKSVIENGLVFVPIKVEPKTTINRWQEPGYNGVGVQSKQSVFTEVVTTFRIYHESGEYIEVQGYGQGVDPQDKGAGKAMTYAMKYMLMYNFFLISGNIDDADKTHSKDIQPPPPTSPQTPPTPTPQPTPQQIQLSETDYEKALKSSILGIQATLDAYNGTPQTLRQIYAIRTMTEAQRAALNAVLIKKKKTEKPSTEKENLTATHAKWKDVIKFLVADGDIGNVREKYNISAINEELLIDAAAKNSILNQKA